MTASNFFAAKKIKQTQSVGKVITSVFWDKKDSLLVDFMSSETTKNLSDMVAHQENNSKPPERRLFHDNIQPHVSA